MLGIVIMVLALGCVPKAATTPRHPAVRVVGSTALLPIARDAARLLSVADRTARVEVFGGGSLTGLQQVAGGWADVALSLVEPPSGEPLYRRLKGKVIGVMPVALVVHPAVQVDNFFKDEVTRIFLGQVRSWVELGGYKHPYCDYQSCPIVGFAAVDKKACPWRARIYW
ncbi:substrate-binding domain-containing protein [Thermodesulfitimonas sp.]